MADLAGGFFGTRGLGSFGGTGRAAPAARRSAEPLVVEAVVVEEVEQPPARPRWSRTAPSAQDTFRRSAAKHPAPKEPAPAKRTTAKKSTQRATAKAAAKKAPAKRTTAKKARQAQEGAGQGDDGQEGRSPEGRGQEGVRHPIGPVNRPSLRPAG